MSGLRMIKRVRPVALAKKGYRYATVPRRFESWHPPDPIGTRLSSPIHLVPESDAVYFTFDDGPDPTYTLQIASMFEQRGHRATFFFTGDNAERHPDLVRQVVAGGHAFGSHSYHHYAQWVHRGPGVLTDQIRGHRAVTSVAGRSTPLFRPPYGHHDWRSGVLCRLYNLDLYLWSSDPADWKPDADPQSIADQVAGELVPGAIILMHDTVYDNPKARNRSATVEAVEQLLETVENRGLKCLALPT